MGHATPAQPLPAHPSGNPSALWLLAMRRGDFELAWTANDRVLAARDLAGRDDPAQPYHLRWVWDGRPFDGRDVLVRCYHGLGDTLQFCRYLAPLRARAASLTLEVQPELLGLLAGVAGPDRLVAFRPDRPLRSPGCDLEIMELAHALRLPPDPAPYLVAGKQGDPRDSGFPGPRRVGLCWHVASAWQPERSLPLRLLAPLGGIAGVTLVSLQRAPGAEALRAPGAPAVANPGDPLTDIVDTARLIAGLDLVVTIDTMVAHLAGALGVPVWLLLLAEPDWRWMAGGRGSPWYRGVRKYRQPRPGDWPAAVDELVADLTRLARQNRVGWEPG